MSGTNNGVSQLFEDAHAEGLLSPGSLQALTVVDLGAQIQAGLGVCVEDVQASEVVLVTVMPDDSASIDGAGQTKTVCDGHNLVLDALMSSKQKDGVLFHTRYLNGHALNPYRPLEDVVRMHKGNYSADKGTPLYDQAVVLLGTVLAKAQEFSGNGVPVRTVTLLITDGGDCSSSHAKAKDVAALVNDMKRAENHIVAAMGIHDGSTDFRRVFREMGIDDKWILTPGHSEQEIRSAFQVFSQSAVQVSQGAASFSRTAMGGFGR
ncbi:hypothetical protein MYSTI_07818 [Myxococcus stipitatus DSM 14675]|uniref:VWFA domain-containing protein n=1 Tax=Myxococcus stipitatus (strain DSM 14675 / JCM 12634 / Mx s8) TaxID=1278073 RepID=L7UMI0_MYXSD|nr:hypothetical protein [Myxococcus stipitatus]AGC49090.1 hypothetical protein MYSTI_07818 [Myxococcus stipitatus DSM 14675]